MNILILCSGNFPNFEFEKHQAFIFDQVNSIKENDKNISFYYHFITGKGVLGYLSNLSEIKKKIINYKIGLIHAHGGMSGFLANLQKSVRVVTTFHGSDINYYKNRIISYFAIFFSSHSIFVSEQLLEKVIIKKDTHVIPCGVDTRLFRPRKKNKIKSQLNLDQEKKYILFSSNFNNKVKNYQLLHDAKNYIEGKFEIIELKNYDRKEVSRLFNAVDIAVMTSFSEGSPQFIKEAMASNCPIISVDVGDVKSIVKDATLSDIVSYNSKDLAEKINEFFKINMASDGRNYINHLNIDLIAKKIINVYLNLV